MNEAEAKLKILERIVVTRQKIIVAKNCLLDLVKEKTDTDQIINTFLINMDAQLPATIIINPAVDPLPNIFKAAESISWRCAICEAIWELIHSNLIIPMSLELLDGTIHISWTTVYQHSGGHSAGWSFDEFSVPVPRKISRPPSQKSTPIEFFSNPDIYLHDLNIPNLHPDIASALTEAVLCFRHELFTACVTMLGKASEGTWLLLGESLLQAITQNDTQQVKKQKDILENPIYGIGKKIDAIMAIYERQDLLGRLVEISGVSVQELRIAANWSDTIRDSRNTIHFGVEPSIPNTYEKVAALLLGVVPNLRVIYRVISSCKSEKKG